jgi:hypothetical protein
MVKKGSELNSISRDKPMKGLWSDKDNGYQITKPIKN